MSAEPEVGAETPSAPDDPFFGHVRLVVSWPRRTKVDFSAVSKHLQCLDGALRIESRESARPDEIAIRFESLELAVAARQALDRHSVPGVGTPVTARLEPPTSADLHSRTIYIGRWGLNVKRSKEEVREALEQSGLLTGRVEKLEMGKNWLADTFAYALLEKVEDAQMLIKKGTLHFKSGRGACNADRGSGYKIFEKTIYFKLQRFQKLHDPNFSRRSRSRGRSPAAKRSRSRSCSRSRSRGRKESRGSSRSPPPPRSRDSGGPEPPVAASEPEEHTGVSVEMEGGAPAEEAWIRRNLSRFGRLARVEGGTAASPAGSAHFERRKDASALLRGGEEEGYRRLPGEDGRAAIVRSLPRLSAPLSSQNAPSSLSPAPFGTGPSPAPSPAALRSEPASSISPPRDPLAHRLTLAPDDNGAGAAQPAAAAFDPPLRYAQEKLARADAERRARAAEAEADALRLRVAELERDRAELLSTVKRQSDHIAALQATGAAGVPVLKYEGVKRSYWAEKRRADDLEAKLALLLGSADPAPADVVPAAL